MEETITITTSPEHSGNSNIRRHIQWDQTPSSTKSSTSEAKLSASTASSPSKQSLRSHHNPYESNPLVLPPHKIKLHPPVTTVTPDQPCTTPSNCIHAFTARSTVCIYGSQLSLFSLYHHRSVSTLSSLSFHMIT